VVPATVAIATLLHYFVEKPGITFGRVIASQFVNKATPITTAEAIPHRLNIP
jgi:peptidoglycan/LPS O-acetylase OafA/YrhL